jgi:LmbE family N-acetylglucosaminyl deacetylase
MPGAADAAGTLALLADPARPEILARTVVVVAHPDDETIGLGAQLHRFRDLLVVHVTDGAPRRNGDPERGGFHTLADYALARRGELEAAMALAGVPPQALATLEVPDQDVATTLPEVIAWLGPLLAGADLVFTHRYEGGHPDHDATAFAVDRAVARMPVRPVVLAMPLYRAGPEGALWQSLPEGGNAAVVLRLTAAERERKLHMLACFATQAATLAPVRLDAECFVDAGREDFSAAPNGGLILYERFGWEATAAGLLEAFSACDAALGRSA